MSEKANIDIEEARALVADAALWPRVRDFLWDFAPQIHASWISDMRLEALPSLMSSPRVRRFVVSSLGVEPCFHTFPKEDCSRMLLLDGATLVSMAEWIGALVLADQLRCVMDGKAVRELKESLRGVYPEVFGYTAYFKNLAAMKSKSAKEHDAPVSGTVVLSVGVGLLLSFFEDLPGPLVSRLRLKLPKSLSGLCAEKGARPDKSFIFKLLKLKFPEAYRLCC